MNEQPGQREPEALPKLKPREKLFVNEYLTNGFNAKQAAIKAGYAESSAAVHGHNLLSSYNVNAHVTAHFQQIDENFKDKHGKITHDLQTIVDLDITDFCNISEDGKTITLKPTAKMPPGFGKYVQDIKIHRNGAVELKLVSKMVARDMLNKHIGYYEKDNQQRAPEGPQIILPDNGR